LELTGLIDSINEASISIDFGRKGFATRGKEQEGRISYEKGIAEALFTFEKAQTSTDPQAIILIEYAFISQELQLCDEADKNTRSSLTQAIQSFDDAFLSLQVVENSAAYKEGDKLFPHHKNHRISGFPKDAFHIACNAHKTRIQNILRSPGIDLIEKDLLQQRFSNLGTAQSGYIAKQKKAMEG
jgi:hypothetical protein